MHEYCQELYAINETVAAAISAKEQHGWELHLVTTLTISAPQPTVTAGKQLLTGQGVGVQMQKIPALFALFRKPVFVPFPLELNESLKPYDPTGIGGVR